MVVEGTNEQMNYPPPESKGTFRYAKTADEKKTLCGFDAEKLEFGRQFQFRLNAGDSFGVLILRHSWMVDEYYTYNVLRTSSFDIWSGTKSFTSMAYGCLMEERAGEVSYNSKIYDFLSSTYHPADARRLKITIGQLLAMTSGLRGAAHGGVGMGVAYGEGAFEYALGFSTNRDGLNCDLISEPGTVYDYSDAGYALLSLAFYQITGEDMRDYVNRKIFRKIGVESAHWDVQGGNGLIGPYTNGHTGLNLSVRDLARIGLLILRKGIWENEQILPPEFLEICSQGSEINPHYGSGFWVNYNQRLVANAPEDTFFMNGYRSNRCYVIPSLDLVVARCGTGPAQWNEPKMLGDVLAAMT
jgi:CubicO group peptidase (beta-lactamase class C family)